MNPQELRIGNYVSYRDEKECLVSCLGHKFETENTYNGLVCGSDDIQEYQPIQLTKEWLIKFGYELEHIPFDSFWSHNELDYNVREVNGKFAFCIESYEDGKTVHFMMHTDKLHEFQNNAFALTGKELTIKN